jgi:hypothetical protein
LWNITHTILRPHIVLQTPPQLTTYQSWVGQVLPPDPGRKLIRFTNTLSSFRVQDGATLVPMGEVYRSRSAGFPTYHGYTRSHYLQFEDSVYASLMEYAEFCKMEDKLAHMVHQYLEDRRNHWLVMVDDLFLMQSLRGYGTKASVVDQTTWITLEKTGWEDMLLVDMDMDRSHL